MHQILHLRRPRCQCRHHHLQSRRWIHHQEFQELEQPHDKLHQIGQHLVSLVENGADIDELIPHLQKLSIQSIQVLNKLQNLEDKGLADMHKMSTDFLDEKYG